MNRTGGPGVIVVLWLFACAGAFAQGISSQAAAQIQAFATDKAARTPAQKKVSSQLIFASRMNRGLPVVPGVQSIQTGVAVDARGTTVVDIRARVDDALLETIRGLGGSVLEYHVQYRSIRASLPLGALETATRIRVRCLIIPSVIPK